MFVLDTTSSMTGLITAAKDKIWSIANTLASADPTPDIRMGLVGYRVIFLVGAAPPKMNYPDDVKYGRSCSRTAQNDIVINTVQCGNLPKIASIWREIAQLGRGETFQVAQSGSAVRYDTPYDEKIAGLSRALDNTRLYYGDADHLREMEARRKTADEIYSEARPSAVAKRTIFNSKAAQKGIDYTDGPAY